MIELQNYLLEYVEERLRNLANHEYKSWINGQQPFVTPRELQLWRLTMFVKYIWFWSLPDDDDLAMIFNLTKRRASNLAADFIARFRKTIIYPVAIRRLYHLINTTVPEKNEKHPKTGNDGSIYSIPNRRMRNTAQYLVDDIRIQLPNRRMDTPYLTNEDISRMWIDDVTVDIIKTNDTLRDQLFDMYKIPGD